MNTKMAANYGTIAGLISFAFFIVLAMMGENPIGNWSTIAALIPIYFLYVGTKKYRDQEMQGSIKFSQAFMFSLTTTFFYSTIFAALAYMYGALIDTELVELIKADLMKNMDQVAVMFGENSKLMDEAIKQIENTNIGQIAWGQYWNKIIWGFIISLIIAGILKKEKPMFDDTTNNNS